MKLSKEAFFRSLLAFHEKGLYEVPHMKDIPFISCFTARHLDMCLDNVTSAIQYAYPYSHSLESKSSLSSLQRAHRSVA